ncbi:MAG: hypothetical protein EXR99_04845 [Gemmataceae bacterium]|nr:hypothetical protein [Gemmataceae bacterium]
MTLSDRTLDAYLDDMLHEVKMAQVEKVLRESPPLQARIAALIQKRDQGDHSTGAIWRRERLTCPSREELASFLYQGLEESRLDYIRFHLQIIGCAFCQANLHDLDPENKNAFQCDKSFREKSSRLVARKKQDG